MRRTIFIATGAALVAGLALTTPAQAHHPKPPREPIPLDLQLGVVKNIDVGFAGRLVLADNQPDATRILSVNPFGRNDVRTIATLPSAGPEGIPVAAQNILGQTWVVLSTPPESEEEPPSGPNLYYISPRGQVQEVGSTFEYQEMDPDPYDTEGNPSESNPYDVTVLLDGSALVADAAGNDVLRVWRNGTIKTVACFPDEVLPTDHLPPGWADDPETEVVEPDPPAIPAEAVPTGVSMGLDGKAYVSELKGFPFRPGTSKVWKVNPNKFGQGCSGNPDNPVAPGSVATSGFSGINDVTVALDGSIYVTELHRDGVLAAEAGFGDPASIAGKGRLTRVHKGTKTEIAAGELTFPGSAAVLFGKVFVADTYLFGARVLRLF